MYKARELASHFELKTRKDTGKGESPFERRERDGGRRESKESLERVFDVLGFSSWRNGFLLTLLLHLKSAEKGKEEVK